FTAFFTFAVISFWIAYGENRNFFFYVTGFFVGLAVMTRQMAGFIPYLIFIAFAVLSKDVKVFKNPHFYGGALLSAVIFLPWHILMLVKHKTFFLEQYFGVTLNFAFRGSNATVNPWHEYLKKILENYWPWLPFFAIGLYKSGRMLLSGDPADTDRKNILFLLSWCFVPFVIFQFAKVKHARYIVPVYVPFSLVTALAIDGFKDPAKSRIIKTLFAISVALSALYLVVPVIPKTLDNRELEDTMILIPAVRKTDTRDILIVNNHKYWDYRNCLWFYADKNTLGLSSVEIADKIRLKKKGYFLMLKDDYAGINEATKPVKKRIIESSRDSVLFSNR
ncbi:MAG: glycosyltransferase family 39 protein, partial [Endomicrobiia bacterium]|nr:glycosyltransferase family 39 protein [Endomicrobiia bacterium]